MSKTERQSAADKYYRSFQHVMLVTGLLCLASGILLFAVIYRDVIRQEVAYLLFPPDKNASVLTAKQSGSGKHIIRPVDEEFGIVIPKIGANAKVVAGVSPFNEKEYQAALTKGVAQARDTALPGDYGNVFIFAHSAANLNLANRYNAVFYLLAKLEKKDSVYLFYRGKKYTYRVTGVKTVSPADLSYLKQPSSQKQLTLMTCWPPGTTLTRLIVQADLVP